jgi:hypothetical protein
MSVSKNISEIGAVEAGKAAQKSRPLDISR